MPTDLEFMQLAVEEARASAAAGEVPIGALLGMTLFMMVFLIVLLKRRDPV